MWDTGRDKKEKALLVTVEITGQNSWSAADAAGELKALVASSGVQAVEEVVCRRLKPNPAFFIGRGKAEEIALLAQSADMDVVIFNADLSSTHQRNLEELIGIKTIDRTQLILDIFAQRAKSSEGKIQVELAQLEYLMPRLTGKGILLSRLGGGIGTRGPGEKKLEMERRRIKERIIRLRKELSKLSQRRYSLREHRRRAALPIIAIVGYTNAGKSTLLNRLTGAQQVVRHSLFSTLDSVARKLTLPHHQKVLFSDTVGFLHKLPHHLIEAFKATLEEVKEADILLHVLDISHPLVYEQSRAVDEVLKELGAERKPTIAVLNKIDLVNDPYILKRGLRAFENSVAVSALAGENIDQLLDKIAHLLADLMVDIEVAIPQSKMALVSRIYREGEVFKQEYHDKYVEIQARVPLQLKAQIEALLKKPV